MIYLFGLIGFLLALTAESKVGNSSVPNFCSETEECLLFDQICKTDEYEVRHYDATKWVSTEEKSMFMEFATMKAFRRLFEYISGANENGEKIEMTAPVIIKIAEDKSPLLFWKPRIYTMSFLLPAKHQANPPKPTDTKLFITDMADMKVYVLSYGGWMLSMTEKINSNKLFSALTSVGAEFQNDYRYAVGYNSPMKMFNRHNEVWYVVEDEPVCSSSEELELSPMA
ncbi:heme-binding protein 2 [Cottoperca gobio]|uniref:Heme-binding protein 1 n=1 Tax=Cottoperca gobio TaxID=56716 RepID=A0A6J2Q501_COTGO|nr:heme-binding protein 2-like [Cottoperca gobio]